MSVLDADLHLLLSTSRTLYPLEVRLIQQRTGDSQLMHHNKGKHQPQVMSLTSNKYRSKFEASIAATLHAKNVAFTYESIRLEYTLEGTYVPDFILPSGVLVEAKGHLRTEDRRKLRAVKTQHPDIDLRLCFQNANEKISKKKNSMRYFEWCDRHGFKWCHKVIPSSWYG